MEHRVSAHLDGSLLTWGRVTVLDDCAPRAGERCSLQVEVELAEEIPQGHSIEVWTHFVSDIERVQVDGRSARTRYGCQCDAVATEPFACPDAKVHGPGSFFPYRRYAGIRLPEGAAPGTRFVFSLGQVGMQTYEETLFNLRFAILDRDRVLGYLGDAFYQVWGSGKSFLRLIGPTCVETGEPFVGRIVVCDRYGNKSGDPLDDLAFDLALDSDPGTFAFDGVSYDAGRRLHSVEGLRFEAEGTYYLAISLRDSPEVNGLSNPIVVRDEWPDRVLWGDLHQHAYYHDGRGTPAANYEYAISTSCLDFCAVAPHQESTYAPASLHIGGTPVQTGWEELIAAADAYNSKDLVTILGSEAGSLGRVAAHMNTYYLDARNRPELERIGVRRDGPGSPRRLESYQEYLEELERSVGEFLLLPHAHAQGGPSKYDLPVLPEYQTNVEICSVHGVFEAFYTQWLSHGHYVGVHGGGDNHMTSTGNAIPGWHYPNTNGLTGLHAPGRTRRGVWDGFKHRKTYAVTGNRRIYLGFTIDGHQMGSIVSGNGAPRDIRIEVAGTAPIMVVELFRNGEVICTHRPDPDERRYLRIVWSDSWVSRRVDDSLTTGRVSMNGGRLSLVSSLNVYHPTDSFVVEDGTVAFRSNAYSGITRGVIVEALDGARDCLRFEIDDAHLGRTVLQGAMEVPLGDVCSAVSREMDVADRFIRACFTREPLRPVFALQAHWIDLSSPRVVSLDWRDEESPLGYYTCRAEQIDGNIAWSSPIWFRE